MCSGKHIFETIFQYSRFKNQLKNRLRLLEVVGSGIIF